ncbi:hypothetical protein AB1Y20_008960 [Prymnesium parvum]|uniref:Cytidyltransferase-like domain-containing protein n=1 Tax=Prymnesium parvum TaxID=97485 RepID=A0AB34JYU2_PRYPA
MPFRPPSASHAALLCGAALLAALLLRKMAARRRLPPAAAAKAPLAALAAALRSQTIRSAADVRRVHTRPPLSHALAAVRRVASRRVGLAVYPGSFNPPSLVHIEIAARVGRLPGVDAVWLDMTSHRSQKLYLDQVLSDRVAMAEAACAGLPRVGVTKLMAEMGEAGWGAAYFETLHALLEDVVPGETAEISWVVGFDVLSGMQRWKLKARDLLFKCARLVVVARGSSSDDEIISMAEDVLGCPRAEFEAAGLQLTILEQPDVYHRVSSSGIRSHLVALLDLVPIQVLRYIVNDDRLIHFYRRVCSDQKVPTTGATT